LIGTDDKQNKKEIEKLNEMKSNINNIGSINKPNHGASLIVENAFSNIIVAPTIYINKR
jgi:hypothetical protein